MKTSIDHLPEFKQQELQIIIALLRDEFDDYVALKNSISQDNQIVKIILFGSHAKGNWVDDPKNGYISDYDILMLINGETLVEEYTLWNKIEEKIQRRISAPLSLIIHSIEDVSNRLQQGHYFFSDIQRQGIELYSCNKKALRQPGNVSELEQQAIAEKYFNQWYKNANGFFKQYQHARNDNEINIAAFQLHQAAERYYGCALLVHSNYLPKTHSLSQLRSFCVEHDPHYIHTFPGTNQFNRRSFQRLKRAYIDARYSEHYEITEEELNWLAEQVEALKLLTEESCLARIEKFSS